MIVRDLMQDLRNSMAFVEVIQDIPCYLSMRGISILPEYIYSVKVYYLDNILTYPVTRLLR